MKKKSLLSTFVVFLTLLLALVGCGSKTEDAETKTKADGEKAKTEESTAYTVEHAMGTTEIPATPEKVVILTNEGTEALLSMGVTPVGAVKSWLGDPWYDHIKGQMEGVEVVGLESEINLEAIAALKPDLIIGNKMRQEEHYGALSAIAPTVFSETLRGDWKVNFELYAKAVHKEEKGKEVISAFDNRIESMKSELGDKVNTEISVVRFMASDIRIYYKDTFSGVIFDQIGFKRPASQDKDEFAAKGVTKERMPEMEGDILFYFTYEPGEGDATKVEEEWVNDPLWNNLEVVKAGKAHKVNDAVWNTAGGVIAANLLLDDLETYFLK
jgi:iron complex transport system substrate-binding protein